MSAVFDPISSALGTDGGGGGLLGAVESIGSIAESAVREIGKGAESLGREVGKIGQAAINNPIGTIAQVAAVATGNAWALPLISATSVVANGGDLGQAALAAGISYAGMAVAGAISDSLNATFANELTSSVGDASLVSTKTLADGSIQHVFTDGSTILQAANGVISTTPATVLPSALSTAATAIGPTALSAINTALANAGGSTARAILSGGDVGQALLGGIAAGGGTLANIGVGIGLKDLGLPSSIANVASATAGAGTKALLSGQDITKATGSALISNIIDTTLAQSANVIKNSDFAKGVKAQFEKAVEQFKNPVESSAKQFTGEVEKLTRYQTEADQVLDQARQTEQEAKSFFSSTVEPSQKAAEAAYQRATASWNEYNPLREKFSDLVSRYDAAVAANDVTLANQLADQANALIPTLNAATDKYNADFTAYDSAKSAFETANNQYVAYANQLTNLNTKYVDISNKATEQVGVITQAAEKYNSAYDQFQSGLKSTLDQTQAAEQEIAKYDPVAQKAFEKSFAEGKDINVAKQMATDVNGYSSVAKEAFSDAYDYGLGSDKAVELAKNVNGLNSTQQNYYKFASELGMSPEEALSYGPEIAKMPIAAQRAFVDAMQDSPNAGAAFDKAQQISQMSKPEQNAYFNARIQGLDSSQAVQLANRVGTLAEEYQTAYIDAVKFGLNPAYAEMFAKSELVSGGGTSLADINENNLKQLTTAEGKEAYAMAVSATGDPAKAFEDARKLDSQSAEYYKQQAASQGKNEWIDANGVKNIIITGTGVTPETVQPLETTPEERGFFDKYAALFGFGTPDQGAGKTTIFGTGATGPQKDSPFALVAFDSPQQKQEAILELDDIIADQTKTPEERQIAQQLKEKFVAQKVGGTAQQAGSTPGETAQQTTTTPTQTGGTISSPSQALSGNAMLQDYINEMFKSPTQTGTTTPTGGTTTPTSGTQTGSTTTPTGGTTTPTGGTTTPTGDTTTPTGGTTPPIADSGTLTPDQLAMLYAQRKTQETIASGNTALQQAIATGDQNIVNAVQSGNQNVISALNSGNTALAQQIASGTQATTGAISELGQQVTAGNTALQQAIATGDQNIVNAVQSGNQGVINALNTGNTALAQQIASGTQATTGAINQLGSNIGSQIGGLGTQIGEGFGGLGTQIGGLGTTLGAGIAGLSGLIGLGNLQARNIATRQAAQQQQQRGMQAIAGTGDDFIKSLSPGLTQGNVGYELTGLAEGGSTTREHDPFATDDTISKSSLRPGLTKAQINYILEGIPDFPEKKAEGGIIDHNPQFFSEGGLGTIENRYVKGDGDGTSDSVPAMLANGEFVIPADVVSSLGNGSNDAGASVLDQFLRTIRDHKRKADAKSLPPDSKGPLAYLIDAKRRAKA